MRTWVIFPNDDALMKPGKSVDEVINKRYGQIVAKLKARDARGIIARTRKS
jgi:hypothetical protein